jgi:hypothetical protein
VDDRTSLIHYTFFKTKCNFRSLKKYFIDKYIYVKILSLIQNIFNIVFKVNGLFISLSTFNWRHSPKPISSAETDLVESTTVQQQLWAGVTTKKLILDIFSIRPNCQPRVSRSSRHTQVMLQTVTLFYIHCIVHLLANSRIANSRVANSRIAYSRIAHSVIANSGIANSRIAHSRRFM